MNRPVKYVKGVGEKRAKLLSKAGIHTLYDLIHYYPRTYIDFSRIVPIRSIVPDTVCCFCAIIGYTPTEHRVRGNMTLYKTMATDGTDSVNITIFNNGYLAKSLEIGEEYIFYGKVTVSRGCFEMSNPLVVSPDSDQLVRPIYKQCGSLNSRAIEKLVSGALKLTEAQLEDTVPDYIRQRYGLCHHSFALKNIHFPDSDKSLELARKRLIFEELLLLQLGMRRLKGDSRPLTSLTLHRDFSEAFCSLLPFTMTSAQQRAVRDCISDMQSGRAMNRLIQGDVGSGKTAVAACLLYSVAKNGMQGAFMAPTEILARQHYASLSALLKDTGISAELLTGSVTAKNKKEVKQRLKNGQTDIIIGTHALLSDDVEFNRLGLVITDEQHRFGVAQRGTLNRKGENPHTLVMSATPIPRTLSLIIYGDLELTVIDELPRGRQKISTYCVDSSYRQRIYNFIRKHLDAGFQAYIVCPAVEEGEDSGLISATEYFEAVSSKQFSDYSVGLLHGKMKSAEKERTMSAFLSGDIQLLVSTTVIEVGIDVPNAVIMVIENADRFGLSQLHQLRGRVGRGKEKSYCVLISDNKSADTAARLDIMCKTTDGFTIADEDLKIRGPGDFFGSRQHGLPELKIADFAENMDIVRLSQQACELIIKNDPLLEKKEHLLLKQATESLFSEQKNLSLN